MKMKYAVIAAAAALFTTGAIAQNESCLESCNNSDQTMGNTSSSAENSQSQATQSNPSSNSNSSASNVTIDPSIQQSGNTVDQSGSNQSATGGNASATGNRSDNRNDSNANNNATNLGGSAINGGQTMGDTTSNSGGNILGNDSSNTNTAQGGAGGAGGKGGAGGAVLGSGNSANDNTNMMGQAQGINSSGNSDVDNANVQGQSMDRSGNSSSSSSASSNSFSTSASEASSDQRQGQTADNDNRIDIDNSDNSSHTTNVDARSLYVPSIAQPVIPSVNPAANITTMVGACGPLFQVNYQPAQGTYLGFFQTSFVNLGHDDFKQPYVDENNVRIKYEAYEMPDGSWEVRGSQALYFITVMNVSGSRHFGLGGGGGSAMNWAQAQGGGSSAMQRMVTNIQAESCVVGRIPAAPAPVTTKRITQ